MTEQHFEFPVTEELYEMEESGTEFVVCQRENPLGVQDAGSALAALEK